MDRGVPNMQSVPTINVNVDLVTMEMGIVGAKVSNNLFMRQCLISGKILYV